MKDNFEFLDNLDAIINGFRLNIDDLTNEYELDGKRNPELFHQIISEVGRIREYGEFPEYDRIFSKARIGLFRTSKKDATVFFKEEPKETPIGRSRSNTFYSSSSSSISLEENVVIESKENKVTFIGLI